MFKQEIEEAIKALFTVSKLLSRLQRWAEEFGATVNPEVDALLSGKKKPRSITGLTLLYN